MQSTGVNQKIWDRQADTGMYREALPLKTVDNNNIREKRLGYTPNLNFLGHLVVTLKCVINNNYYSSSLS